MTSMTFSPEKAPLPWTVFSIDEVKTELRTLGVDQLEPGIWQHRKLFNKRGMDQLGASMRKSRINAIPLVVVAKRDGTGYMIIAGERRWRAAQEAGIHQLRCIVGDYTPEQARFIAAAENLQREGLNPIEEANSYFEIQETGLTHDQIADQFSKSRGHISNTIRLLSLGFAVRELIANGKLSGTQARPLCSLTCTATQLKIGSEAVKKNWSVRVIAAEVAKHTKKTAPTVSIPKDDADVRRLSDLISTTTGYPCVIQRKPNGSWQMGFAMSNADEFEGMLARLGVKVNEGID